MRNALLDLRVSHPPVLAIRTKNGGEMIVRMKLQTPAGFEWDAALDTESSIIMGFTVENNTVSALLPPTSLADDTTMDLVWALVSEWFHVSECGVLAVSIDGIDLSDEWIESVYKTVHPDE